MPKSLTVWITINWKILKEMGIPDSLTCLLRNLYAGQEATVRTGHGTTDWFQIGKGARQGCILSPCLFNLYAEYIMRNAGLEEAQAGIKIARRNINNLWYAGICREKAMATQYSCLENPIDRGAWKAAVHGVTKSWTWLCDFTFTFHFHALKKEMATHASILAERIPGTEEPGGLLSMGSHRVGHNWSDLAAAAAAADMQMTPPLRQKVKN